MPVVIETEDENFRMLVIVEKLMKKGEDLSAEEEKLLKLLAKLIEDFEQRYYKPEEAEPISKTHARALANYFHVPADLFI